MRAKTFTSLLLFCLFALSGWAQESGGGDSGYRGGETGEDGDRDQPVSDIGADRQHSKPVQLHQRNHLRLIRHIV